MWNFDQKVRKGCVPVDIYWTVVAIGDPPRRRQIFWVQIFFSQLLFLRWWYLWYVFVAAKGSASDIAAIAPPKVGG